MSILKSQHLPPSLGSGQMFSSVNTIGSAYQRSSPTYQRSSPKLQKVPENDEVNLENGNEPRNNDKQRDGPGVDWNRFGYTSNYTPLQTTIIRLFRENGAHLLPGEMRELHICIRKILGSKTGQFLFEYYQKQLTKGMIILREGIKLEEGLSLITKLEAMWDHFFTKILPTLEAVMYPLKTKGFQVIRRAALQSFRDVVVLKVSFEAALQLHANNIPPGIKHMLLVLQNVHDSYPPNAKQTQLEKLVAVVVVPYLGYHGLYYGEKEPEVVSSEPEIVSRKKSVELAAAGRRVSRPLSVQPRQLENLQEMFFKAIRKEQASDFAR